MKQKKAYEIQLIGLDLDGTLFNDQKQISAHTLDVLHRAMQQGVYVAPATGRPVNGLPAALLALPGLRYAVTSNGARVMDLTEGRALAQFPVPLALAARVVDTLSAFDCQVSLFCGGKRIFHQKDYDRLHLFVQPNMLDYVRRSGTPVEDIVAYAREAGQGIEKLNAFFQSGEERRRAWAALERLPDHLVITSSLPLNMEINAPGVDKGRGLLALAAHLGIGREQVMACGDSGNDLAMLRAVGLGVAMANSTREILEAADYVTLSNEQDGVAAAVERFVL